MSRETLVEKLKTDIVQGRVVTVAGTGVSVAACRNQLVDGDPVATWWGLLKHGVKYCKEVGAADESAAKLLAMQIDSGATDFLISAAETISQRLMARSPGMFRGWLKDTVGRLSVREPGVLEALHALPGVLATLNYDGLIEQATERQAVTWLNSDRTQEVLRREFPDAVLHLHGWFEEPESVVLGLRSYLAVSDHPHAKAVLQLFTLDRTLLFVGCGDTVLDPNFTRLIEWGKEALKDVSPRHFLLCRAIDIDEMQEKLRDAPWLQPLCYGTSYSDLVPFLRSLTPPEFFPSIVAAPAFDLAAYQRAMRKRYGRLKLEDLDPSTHDIGAVNLTGMFIRQDARECAEFLPRVFELPKELQRRLLFELPKELQRRLHEAGKLQVTEPDEQTLAEYRRAYLAQSLRPVLDVVNDPSFARLVILGDPGSGKSTLLQYLLLQWAEKVAPDTQWDSLPLLIELREYARLRHCREVTDFLDYLHAGASVRWRFDKVRLAAWLRTNTSLVLFDGLDEVFDTALHNEVTTAIHRFADEFPRARVVVTSRIIGFQHQSWRYEGFRHFMLQELNEPQIAEFLVRWHPRAYEDAGAAESKRALLARAIEDSVAIRQLAGNPLLLTMMAILNRTQDLPRDRAELYEQCARLLLHNWKVDLAFAHDPELSKVSLDYKDKRGLMVRVAGTMQASAGGLAGNLLDEQQLEDTLADGLGSFPNLRPRRAALALIEQLRGRNFMLCSVGVRSYAFVHRTFLEYFCALEIRERFQTEQILTLDQLKADIFGRWLDASWHEVLCLLAGMLAPRFVAEILEWLLVQPDRSGTCEHVFLAARCVGEVRKRAELGKVEQRVRAQTEALAGFEFGYFYESWWVEARIVAAVRIRAIRAVRAVWRNASDVGVWLKARAESDDDDDVRRTAVEELARGWKEDPETLPWLKARAQSDANSDVRRTALVELARGWKEDPETLPWLKGRAQFDQDDDVRRTAVEELARGWKEDAETLPIVKARAQSDKKGDVRRTAVLEVARGWKEDPETLPWLKARVQSDASNDVRRAAVEELARGWKEDPETLPWLKARAQSDKESDVRRTAVLELARGWKGDPEILPWLKTQAQSDASGGVRRAAVEELVRGWKEGAETLPWLKVRAQSDQDENVRWTAVLEVARGWRADPDALRWLKARAQSDQDEDVRRTAVEELARGWKEDPAILRWLQTRAKSDVSSSVRRTAVLELARGWKDDPETLPILKACAQSDENSDIRRTVVLELARGWKEDSDTLPILKVCAQSDQDDDVRRTAVLELARGWKEDPETLPIVKARAQSDKKGNVRRTAVEELARGWKEEPETLPILKARAQSDDSSDVRWTAVLELARGWKNDPDVRTFLVGLGLQTPAGRAASMKTRWRRALLRLSVE